MARPELGLQRVRVHALLSSEVDVARLVKGPLLEAALRRKIFSANGVIVEGNLVREHKIVHCALVRSHADLALFA